MTETPFTLTRPKERTTSVVFASPHSGNHYAPWLRENVVLDAHAIRTSEDAFVDQLFACAPDHGAPLLAARIPRAIVDLNRGVDELDPALIEGVRRNVHNPRIVSGLGVIPRVVAGGRAIYRGKLSLTEAHDRLKTYWHPYHDQLQALLDENARQFGQAILIDCHSMAREALDSARSQSERPEIVIGDRFGASASKEIVDQVAAAFRDAGFRVAHNSPFAGAYSTIAYGRPARSQHAIQVEIDRSLYMNEQAIEPHLHFDRFRDRMSGVIEVLVQIGAQEQPMAAE